MALAFSLRLPMGRRDSGIPSPVGGYATFWDGHDWVSSVEFSPTGKGAVTVARDSNVGRVWDVGTGIVLYDLETGGNRIVSSRFAPDGNSIATLCEDGKAQVWNSKSGTLDHQFVTAPWPAHSIAFSANGQRLVTTHGATVSVYDEGSGSELLSISKKIIPERTTSFTSAAVTADGSRILTSDGIFAMWDAHSGKQLFSSPAATSTGAAVISADGSKFATSQGR